MKRIRSQDLDPELRVRIITFLEGRDHWAPLKDIVAEMRDVSELMVQRQLESLARDFRIHRTPGEKSKNVVLLPTRVGEQMVGWEADRTEAHLSLVLREILDRSDEGVTRRVLHRSKMSKKVIRDALHRLEKLGFIVQVRVARSEPVFLPQWIKASERVVGGFWFNSATDEIDIPQREIAFGALCSVVQKAGGRDTREHIHEMVLPRLEQIEARHIDQALELLVAERSLLSGGGHFVLTERGERRVAAAAALKRQRIAKASELDSQREAQTADTDQLIHQATSVEGKVSYPPCFDCRHRFVCSPGGVINPIDCKYMKAYHEVQEW